MKNEKNHKMQELNEKFVIEYDTWTDSHGAYSVTQTRSITKDDLWMIDVLNDKKYIWDEKCRIKFVRKEQPINTEVRELMLKAKYEMGGEKYCEGKKEFEEIK